MIKENLKNHFVLILNHYLAFTSPGWIIPNLLLYLFFLIPVNLKFILPQRILRPNGFRGHFMRRIKAAPGRESQGVLACNAHLCHPLASVGPPNLIWPYLYPKLYNHLITRCHLHWYHFNDFLYIIFPLSCKETTHMPMLYKYSLTHNPLQLLLPMHLVPMLLHAILWIKAHYYQT